MYGMTMPQNNMYGGYPGMYGGGGYPSYGGGGGGYPGMDPYGMGGIGPLAGMGTMGGGMGPMGGGFAPSGGEYQRTLGDSFTGGVRTGSGGFFGGFSAQPNEGYGLDFNRNGRYDRGRDGVLVFDTDRDGKFEQKDVQNTNNMMQAATGNFDFNNNGKVSFAERIQGAILKRKFQQLDSNRDGQLSADEISRGGGGVWMDQNRNGRIGNGEVNSAFNVPSNGRFGPTERLDFVNPFQQTSHTSSNGMGGHGPFGGGGYPGGGCGCGASYGQPGMYDAMGMGSPNMGMYNNGGMYGGGY